MNCAEAKQVSIIDYLERKGYKPCHRYPSGLAYIAAYRGEKTPSLMVRTDGTLFNDWGIEKGGSIIDLAMLFCATTDVAVGLREIEETMGPSFIAALPASSFLPPPSERVSTYEDVEILSLTSRALIAYAASRGIPAQVLSTYCCEVHYRLRGHSLYSIGWANRSGGFELRNGLPKGKGAIAPKDITVVGDVPGSTCLVFEGFFDFLSAVTMRWLADGRTAVVLNSTTLANKAIPVLQQAGEVHLWLDRDAAGHRATEDIITAIPGAVDYSARLVPANDVNDFYSFSFRRAK